MTDSFDVRDGNHAPVVFTSLSLPDGTNKVSNRIDKNG